MKVYILIIVTIFSVFSCKNTRHDQIRDYVTETKGNRIHWPDTLRIKDLEVDSLYSFEESMSFIDHKTYKITTCIDGTCHSCIEQLIGWKHVINKFPEEKVKFLFFIHADHYSRFELFNCEEINFNYPVIYDYKNYYQRKNHIPDDFLLNTMLISPRGKILLIGNPIKSDEILDLYLEEIL